MGRDGREALLDAAERLFATQGVDAVSLRQIGVAAGQRNTAAAHYHFGTKEGLVAAVLERRMAPVDEHRLAMLAALDADGRGQDPVALVEALVVPFAAAVHAGTTHARFAAQVLAHPSGSGPDTLDRPYMSSLLAVFERLDAALGGDPLWPERRRLLAVLVVQGLADRERALAGGLAAADDTTARAALLAAATAVAIATKERTDAH